MIILKGLMSCFDKFDPKDIVKDYIFFEGKFYDTYSVLLDILNEVCSEIIIIDNYAGKELLDTLRNIDRKKLYLCGASFKDLGKKCFEISEFGDSFLLDEILKVIEEDIYESK